MESKRCSKCGETKPTTQFGKHKAWRDGYFPQCRECKRAGDRASHAKHKESRNRRANERYAADPEPFKARMKKRYRENPEAWNAYVTAWQAANPERVRQYKQKWYEANVQGAVRENVRRRYARRMGAPTIIFSKAQLEQRMSMFGNRCWICAGPREAVDHVKPLAKGGSHMLCNLRPICTTCNARKGATWPFEPVKSR